MLIKYETDNKLYLSYDEFHIIKSSIVEICESYYKPKKPKVSFEDKFHYSLSEHEKLEKEFIDIVKQKAKQFIINIDLRKLKIYLSLLQEILNNYAWYEFQIITGYEKFEVQKVYDDLKTIIDNYNEK